MESGQLIHVVSVYILLNRGGVIKHVFETVNRMCDYQVYEIVGKLESDFVTLVENEHGYPELEVVKSRCYGISIRRVEESKF